MRLGAFDHLQKPIGRVAEREVLARALRPQQAAGGSVNEEASEEFFCFGRT
jgi:hypothetical protein